MSTQLLTTERIAAAGRPRVAASPSYVDAGFASTGFAAVAATSRHGWASNPSIEMQVKATKRHDLTPAPRPEEGSP